MSYGLPGRLTERSVKYTKSGVEGICESNMKRSGKCVGKKTYATRSKALAVARKWYLSKGKIEMGIYECPTCLDFHLTTKYCNTRKYHKRWLHPKVRKPKPVIPLSNTKIKKLKRLEYKKTIIPIQKQREILSLLNKSYPQKVSFWGRINGIIKRIGIDFPIIR